ncbi:phosphoheptose isomerase [Candidatus Saccharibacteria bacterium]|nr:phosphoheptose isomerase [Candidatus Saccharibacteria bacterium]
MSQIVKELTSVDLRELDRYKIAERIAGVLGDHGYEVVEVDTARPWGQFFRIRNDQARKFMEDFFQGLELTSRGFDRTPKILLHYPMQRNSWQYHDRRKEFWKFLTDGFYYKNMGDEQPGEPMEAKSGEIVTFEPQERHRLSGHFLAPTLVAEIWEHIAEVPSDEDDIIRLLDDYKLIGREVGK